jgi:hypothetical protein
MDDPSEELNDGVERLEKRLRALGTRNPRCSYPSCAERDPFSLTGAHPELLCREHAADRDGRSWTERHHVATQANDPRTVPIPANDHAVLTSYLPDWPRETLRNPDGSPLLRAAATIRGWLDVMRLLLERAVGGIPDFLERLDAYLREELGSRWWDDFRARSVA